MEYGADQRKHELQYDVNGVNRDFSGQSFRIGTTFQLTGYLVGEFAVGRLERIYVDPNFDALRGNLVDASLTYYPNPLTTLKLDMRTSVQNPSSAASQAASRMNIRCRSNMRSGAGCSAR